MTKQRPRFFTKALIGMGAVTLLTVTISTPARAETKDLVCSTERYGDLHVYVDTDRQSVVTTMYDKRYGPFDAAISDTFIRWTGREENNREYQNTIDRVTATITKIVINVIVVPANFLDATGKCRRATQKF